ncbi:hypothetical protein DTO021C3_988 [Paecilomyces variotii]|nr:hypothetical protein DTO021C3_988 [Paecilomyces variotii]KAJ9307378.1 hypothetical protein DTO217A2_3060 [Paecilomyces variotii]
MAPPRRYITLDGQPPLGGLPPNVAAAMQHRARESPPPYTAAPAPSATQPPPQHGHPVAINIIPEATVCYVPRPIIGANPSWQPWTPLVITRTPPNAPSCSCHDTNPAKQPPAASNNPPFPPGSNMPGTTDSHPVTLSSGAGYIFPTNHTTIHLIEPNFLPCAHPPRQFKWRVYKVPTTLSLSELIEKVCVVDCPEGKTAVKGIVECIELGDGCWLRGPEFWMGKGKGEEDAMKGKVKKTLASIGWDEKRGSVAKPVWLAVVVEYV